LRSWQQAGCDFSAMPGRWHGKRSIHHPAKRDGLLAGGARQNSARGGSARPDGGFQANWARESITVQKHQVFPAADLAARLFPPAKPRLISE
jgi:hypothetical protein